MSHSFISVKFGVDVKRMKDEVLVCYPAAAVVSSNLYGLYSSTFKKRLSTNVVGLSDGLDST